MQRSSFALGLLIGLLIVPVGRGLWGLLPAVGRPCSSWVGLKVDDVIRLEALEARQVSVRVDVDDWEGVAEVVVDGVLDHEVRGHRRILTFDRRTMPYVVATCTERSWNW